jgi:hypothetical protein
MLAKNLISYRKIQKNLKNPTIGDNMFKRVITVFLFTLLLTTLTFAQYGKEINRTGGIARIMSMGNSPYLIDPYFIAHNPAWSAIFTDFIFGDIGSSTGNDFGSGGNGQFIYADFRLDRQFTMGAYLARNDFSGISTAALDPFDITGQINSIGGSVPVIPMDNNIVFLISYIAGAHNIGVSIAYAGSSNEENLANGQSRTGNASQFGLNVGYMGMLTRSIRLAVAAYFMTPSATREAPNVNATKFDQTIIGVNSRIFINMSRKVTVVPIFSYLSTKGSADIGDDQGVTSTDLPELSRIKAGFGIVFEHEKLLVTGGPSIEISTTTNPAIAGSDPERKNSVFSFPIWNFGAEWELLEWLTARLGYNVSTNKVTTESTANLTSVNEQITTQYFPANGGMTIGLGFQLGAFYLDATINEDVLRQGFNNIGGGGATFAYLSTGMAF